MATDELTDTFIRGCINEAWLLLRCFELDSRSFRDQDPRTAHAVRVNTRVVPDRSYRALRQQDQLSQLSLPEVPPSSWVTSIPLY